MSSISDIEKSIPSVFMAILPSFRSSFSPMILVVFSRICACGDTSFSGTHDFVVL